MSKTKMFNKVAQQPVFPCDPYGGEIVSAIGDVVNQTAIIYTVGAGKILYITDWAVTFNHGGVLGSLYAAVYNTVPVVDHYITRDYNISCYFANGMSLTTPYVLPTGYSVRIFSSIATSRINFNFHGWLFGNP